MGKKQKNVKKNHTPQNDTQNHLKDQVQEAVEAQEKEPQNTENQKDMKSESSASTPDAQKELAALQQQYDELKDKYMRLLADFENYKKRAVREKMEFMQTAAADTMAALLPVLDDFDRAKKNSDDENSVEKFSEGVELVYQKLHNVLRQRGLEAMKTDGEDFDAEYHEALTEIPAPTEELKGKIVDTVEKGYKLKDKIIRHAKVVVGK
ncbi:MAG: nucleotide exchange factor GrpE [Bacteroidetes bacterium]|nr:MAG: nucleotide exchange factor GrpE [Bacteroidota bacterium]